MAHLYKEINPSSKYYLMRGQFAENEALANSTTLYVGNLSFYTKEEQLWELFSRIGEVKQLIMGLNKKTLEQCGFCFVVYYTHEAAADCVNFINGTKIDDRVIRVDWDPGFEEGRQYGKGISGGQVRDDYRRHADPERKTYGRGDSYQHRSRGRRNDYYGRRKDSGHYKRRYEDDHYHRRDSYSKKQKISEEESRPTNEQNNGDESDSEFFIDEFNRKVPKNRLQQKNV